jgi:hypothetical protein
MVDVAYALSLKQPWATLLVHGRKSIEVRNWPTARRGRVLIHAARVADSRPEGWALLPTSLSKAAKLCGGIVGEGMLADCRPYKTLEAFVADRSRHLNDPTWFRPPVLYGFVFQDLVTLPFLGYPGWMRFFPVELNTDKHD